MQPQTPLVPPPPHVKGVAHPIAASAAQHAWPLPTHAPHVTPHVSVEPHAVQATPPWPHAEPAVPGSQVVPSQQPEQDVPSHVHAPPTHLCPSAHAPCVHTPMHPSLAPQALPAQLAVQVPSPQAFGVPAPPHDWPTSHPPQSMMVPQRLTISPHLPAHSVDASGTHAGPPVVPSASQPSAAARLSKSAPRMDAQPSLSALTMASAATARRRTGQVGCRGRVM